MAVAGDADCLVSGDSDLQGSCSPSSGADGYFVTVCTTSKPSNCGWPR